MSLNAPPERRSDADLQRILDGLIGDAGSVLSGELISVIGRYEQEHNLIILDNNESEQLRAFCITHPDFPLGPKELFAFLSTIPKPRPNSPNPGLTHSSSAPPTSFPSSTPRQNRRHSDRIRSPSDESSSSEEDGQSRSSSRASRQTSAPPPDTGRSFPTGGHRVSSFGSKPIAPKRVKTLSDSSRLDSPLATRVRGAPPSAFHSGPSFARPSPAGGRRRRGSQNADDAGMSMSPEAYRPGHFARSMSSGSLALGNMGTPTNWRDGSSRPTSPLSPSDGTLDMTSYHRAKSPEVMSEVDAAERTLMEGYDDGEHGEMDDGEDDMGEIDDDVVGDQMITIDGSLDARLSRISTESTASLRTSHDKLRALQKQNTELGRKLKESERQLSVLGSENERMVEDLQDKLEEARAEVAQRKKDEKDLKSKDRTQLIQIAGLEADIQSLQRSLENSKANHANMQKMYNSQCEEAQRLRGMLLDRDNEIKELEQLKQNHEDDEKKYTQEIQALESEVKRIETELSIARQAESFLETQKQENLQLKETIDRMRFDLDEARSAASKSNTGSVHLRGVTSSSGGGTLSRNLGDELTRRLLDAESISGRSADERGSEGDADSFIETIVTTQRTRKVGSRATAPAQQVVTATSRTAGTDETSGDEEEGEQRLEPVIRIQDGVVREYADASTETEPVAEVPAVASGSNQASGEDEDREVGNDKNRGSPPAYSAKPEQPTPEAVLLHAHPREHGDLSLVAVPEEAYDEVAHALGVRCTVLEDEMRAKRAQGARSVGRRRSDSGKVYNIFFNRGPSIVDHAGVLTIGAIGLILGIFIHASVSSHTRNQTLNHLNGFVFAAGGSRMEIMPYYKDVLNLATGAVAGRIPT